VGDWFRLSDLQERFGISYGTALRWTKGGMPCKRLGTHMILLNNDSLEWIEKERPWVFYNYDDKRREPNENVQRPIKVDPINYDFKYVVENKVAVTRDGIVLKNKNGNMYIAPQTKKSNGYLCVSCSISGRTKLFPVHRLVAEAYIPNPNGYPQTNHIDGNKLNNHCENLEWCTPSQNMTHAYETGLIKHSRQDVSESKERTKAILHLRASGENYAAIGARFGISAAYVGQIVFKSKSLIK